MIERPLRQFNSFRPFCGALSQWIIPGDARMIDRVLCSGSSMAQLAQWLLVLLLLPGIAPGLTFMAVGVDFLWPAQKKKKKTKNSFLVLYLLRFVFCFVFTDLFAFVAVRWRRGIFPPPLSSAAPLPSPLLLHAHWKIFVESMRNAAQLPAF